MAFLADGKTALLLWRNGQRVSIVPPKGLIIVDEYLRQEQNHRKRRFVLAHEAGHILMDRLGNNPVTSAFSREFDTEKCVFIGAVTKAPTEIQIGNDLEAFFYFMQFYKTQKEDREPDEDFIDYMAFLITRSQSKEWEEC